MSKHLTTENVLDVPEIVHAGQRVLRTLVQAGIPAFLTFAVILPQVIDALGLPLTSKAYLWLVGLAGIVTGIAAALTRIMAIPTINQWLTTIGLGTMKKTDPRTPATTPADPTQDPAAAPPTTG
ncbi:hypothetical protein O159_17090 [Leifsonia xyli subsp. cynodontis DSM 46306]|uniref:Uncharacterized protein n=1 Tax=Leifsonia xyli subsp. cynodontis DSM 46306 TaxID=1389489 RepID=U3PA98_LEIXC|nr:hypothetical protein [Leifsonia xyli]AGW41752.1 hypothetical protein O159_17090 [Leifsonia xyli subsp. cynodontis DSM 46306]